MSGGRESELRILRPTELEPRRFDEPERKCQNPQYVDETPGDPIDKQLLEAANFEGQSQDHMAPCSYERDASEYYPSHIQRNALSILRVENRLSNGP